MDITLRQPRVSKFAVFLKDLMHEVRQSEALRSGILYEILYSKRLLIEHVEVLEEALYDIEKELSVRETNYLNPLTAGALVTVTGVTSLFSSKFAALLLPSIAYSALYASKSLGRYRTQRSCDYLRQLLSSVERFENVVKKHILFFNELQRFKVGRVVDDQTFVNTCIQCLKDVILVLYDAVKDLETDYVIDRKYETVYERMEDLYQTEYFTSDLESFGAKNIKEFLNLFLYVQSQYLMRLGLISAAGGVSDRFVKYNTMNLVPLIDEQTSNCNYNFDIVMFVSSPDKPSHSFKRLNERKVLPLELLRANSYCANFVPKLLAISHQCVSLETQLQRAMESYEEGDQERDEFFDLVPVMSQLDSELLTCQEEFQRLFLTYQKFLNMTPAEAVAAPEAPAKEETSVRVEHDFRKVGDTVFGHHDEFFALDVLAKDLESEPKATELDEDEVINRKIVKRAFKPVLSQLKQKIEPIAGAMKEREMKVLKEKGIDCMEESLSDFEMTNRSSSDDENEEKPRKFNERYNDMRQELAQKQQFNPFAMAAAHFKRDEGDSEDVFGD